MTKSFRRGCVRTHTTRVRTCSVRARSGGGGRGTGDGGRVLAKQACSLLTRGPVGRLPKIIITINQENAPLLVAAAKPVRVLQYPALFSRAIPAILSGVVEKLFATHTSVRFDGERS